MKIKKGLDMFTKVYKSKEICLLNSYHSNKSKPVVKEIATIVLNQNKPLPPPPPKDREIHISGKSRHKR